MPRISRAVAIGYPHHITQRGNYQQSVFEDDADFAQYLLWLKEYSERYFLKIWAYCLMSNHVHFVGVPMRNDSLARTFNTLHMRYSQYFNRKGNRKGHLWQGRFFSCVLDEKHIYTAIRYVENNPVRANIVKKPDEYRWSSVRGHIYRGSDSILSDDCYLINEIDNWMEYLAEKDDVAMIDNIRLSTKTGRPCGDEYFIKAVEGLLERRLMALPKGRPGRRKK
ncbi:MAG: transposase [Nitrospirota bacterium]